MITTVLIILVIILIVLAIKEQIKNLVSALKDKLIREENRYIESKKKFSNRTKVKITILKHKTWTISRGYKYAENVMKNKDDYLMQELLKNTPITEHDTIRDRIADAWVCGRRNIL